MESKEYLIRDTIQMADSLAASRKIKQITLGQSLFKYRGVFDSIKNGTVRLNKLYEVRGRLQAELAKLYKE